MAVELEPEVTIGTGRARWIASGVAGIVAGAVFGLMASIMMPDLMGMIGALYGFEGNVAVGWIAHLFHSMMFGLVYAGIVSLGPIRGYAGRVTTGVGVGLGYGLIVWAIAGAFVMPAWLGAMTMASPAVPTFNPISLVGHAVYGIILGASYPMILAWWS